VCVPRQPRCDECPLQSHCVASKRGLTTQLPERGRRPAVRPCRVVAFIAERQGQFWVRQRPASGRNAGLWEFPNLEVDGNPLDLPALARQVLGVAPGPLRPLTTIRHSITCYRITLEAFRLALTRSPRAPGHWCDRAALQRLPLTAAHRRIAGLLGHP